MKLGIVESLSYGKDCDGTAHDQYVCKDRD